MADGTKVYADLNALNAACPLTLVDSCGLAGNVGAEITLQEFLDAVCNIDPGDGAISVIQNTVAGNPIMTHLDGAGQTTVVNETVTTIGIVGNVITYVNEAGVSTSITIPTGPGGGAISSLTNTVAGHLIGIHNDGNGNAVPINETITALNLVGNVLTYTDENGAISQFTLPTGGGGATSVIQNIVAGHPIFSHFDGDSTTTIVNETVTDISIQSNVITYVREDGTIRTLTIPIAQGGAISALSNTIAGHQIAIHSDGNNNNVPINETITTLALNGNILTYINEAGLQVNLTLPNTGGGGSTSSFSNTVAGHLIGVHNNGNGQSVNVNETITSLSVVGNVITFVNEAGVSSSFTLPSSSDSVSTLTNLVTGHRIATHDNGNGQILNIRETVTSITLVGSTLRYTDENGAVNSVNLAGINSDSITTVTNLIAGNRIATINNGAGQIREIDETITGLSLNANTSVITYSKEGGGTDTIDLESLHPYRQVNAFTGFTMIHDQNYPISTTTGYAPGRYLVVGHGYMRLDPEEIESEFDFRLQHNAFTVPNQVGQAEVQVVGKFWARGNPVMIVCITSTADTLRMHNRFAEIPTRFPGSVATWRYGFYSVYRLGDC